MSAFPIVLADVSKIGAIATVQTRNLAEGFGGTLDVR